MLRRAFSYVLPGKVHLPVESAVQGYVKPKAKYVPAQTVEFDHLGESLIYSAEAFNHASVLFPFPWSLTTYVGFPASALAWWTGALGPYSLFMVVPAYLSLIPHLWHIQSLRNHVHKVWYVRGGILRIETKDLTGVTCYSYIEPSSLSVKGSNGSYDSVILDTSGNLTKKLQVKVTEWGNFDQGAENATLTLAQKGKVHNPELFDAIFKGYDLEVENFEMNFNAENSMVSNKSIGGYHRL
mmetsp:Transcript_19120/g.34807  ORF Transcript_19120/g.34807 Transcript_19120/m.34807 type:complete len:240 (-) Transcript_19120:2241-2960(-)